MYRITFNFEQPGLNSTILENIKDGYSVLEIALMNDVELHYNCGGVCSCTTCHVYVNKGEEFLEGKSIREQDFLSRAMNPGPNSRLACQCLLNPGEGELEVTIPNQTELPDE